MVVFRKRETIVSWTAPAAVSCLELALLLAGALLVAAPSGAGTLNFGTVGLGSFADQTFTVQNTGGGTVSGTASAPAPFSVVSGSPFSLVGAGATQAVTVRFGPTLSATVSANVTFTANGGTIS